MTNVLKYLENREKGDGFKISNSVLGDIEEKYFQSKIFEEYPFEKPEFGRVTYLIVFSPDGKIVASTNTDHNIYLHEIATRKLIRTLIGHSGTPWTIKFHPKNPNLLASGCFHGKIRVWNLESNTSIVLNFEDTGPGLVISLAFQPTEDVLLVAKDNCIYFWNWNSPKPMAKIKTENPAEKIKYISVDNINEKLIIGITNADIKQPLKKSNNLKKNMANKNLLNNSKKSSIAKNKQKKPNSNYCKNTIEHENSIGNLVDWSRDEKNFKGFIKTACNIIKSFNKLKEQNSIINLLASNKTEMNEREYVFETFENIVHEILVSKALLIDQLNKIYPLLKSTRKIKKQIKQFLKQLKNLTIDTSKVSFIDSVDNSNTTTKAKVSNLLSTLKIIDSRLKDLNVKVKKFKKNLNDKEESVTTDQQCTNATNSQSKCNCSKNMFDPSMPSTSRDFKNMNNLFERNLSVSTQGNKSNQINSTETPSAQSSQSSNNNIVVMENAQDFNLSEVFRDIVKRVNEEKRKISQLKKDSVFNEIDDIDEQPLQKTLKNITINVDMGLNISAKAVPSCSSKKNKKKESEEDLIKDENVNRLKVILSNMGFQIGSDFYTSDIVRTISDSSQLEKIMIVSNFLREAGMIFNLNYNFNVSSENVTMNHSDQEELLPNLARSNFVFGMPGGIYLSGVDGSQNNSNDRLQVWDLKNKIWPDINSKTENIVVPNCCISNDASIDISSDGNLIVAPIYHKIIVDKIGIYSLNWENLGHCYHIIPLQSEFVCVSFSQFDLLMVGISTNTKDSEDEIVIGKIFKINENNMANLIRTVKIKDKENQIINCLKWLPNAGRGIVFGGVKGCYLLQ